MGYLFDRLPFPEGSRMTGVWIDRNLDEPVGEEIAFGQLINLRADQDPVVESDFISGHAPYTVGGLYGVYPDGSGWVFLLQKAPADAHDLIGAPDPWWPMVDGVARALDQCPGASTSTHLAWTRAALIGAYAWRCEPRGAVDDWPMSALLWGLLAESCGVGLGDIAAAAYPEGCVFAGEEHVCDLDVFTDVFSRWSARLIQRSETEVAPAPHPTPDADLLRRFLKHGAQPSTAGDPQITYAHENLAAWRTLKAELSDKKYRALRRAVKEAYGRSPPRDPAPAT